MRKFETPYVADWLAASVRWIVLVGLIIAVALRGQLGGPLLWPLVFIFLWNIVISLLAAFSIRAGRYHRQIIFVIDFLLAALAFWLEGGFHGAAAWVGLIPILTGAIYFEMWGAFLAAGLFTLWQFYVSLDLFSGDITLESFSDLAWTLVVGLVSGLGGRFVMSRLRTLEADGSEVPAAERLTPQPGLRG